MVLARKPPQEPVPWPFLFDWITAVRTWGTLSTRVGSSALDDVDVPSASRFCWALLPGGHKGVSVPVVQSPAPLSRTSGTTPQGRGSGRGPVVASLAGKVP